MSTDSNGDHSKIQILFYNYNELDSSSDALHTARKTTVISIRLNI